MGFLCSPNCLKYPPDSARLSGKDFSVLYQVWSSRQRFWFTSVDTFLCCFFVFLNACEIFCAFSWFLVLLLTNLLLPPRIWLSSSSDIFCYDFFFRSLARVVFSSLFGSVLIFSSTQLKRMCCFRSLIFFLFFDVCWRVWLTWICMNSRLFCWAFFRFLYFGWYNSEHIAISAHLCESQEFYLHFFFTDVHRHEILANLMRPSWGAERKVDLLLVRVKKLSLWLDGVCVDQEQNSELKQRFMAV